jgi:hypothetical protein
LRNYTVGVAGLTVDQASYDSGGSTPSLRTIFEGVVQSVRFAVRLTYIFTLPEPKALVETAATEAVLMCWFESNSPHHLW